ncbi:MAG TPA: 3-hydroxyacyl-CoA dehydrogenase family protein [Bryobacteraceae bacterium]|nr:3-hydroxyacyl-CoA dehydrogenase family protein [Bryobacteraceae bacterium]
MNQIAVTGAGLMGHSLAIVFAVGGCDVTLYDVSAAALTAARGLIASTLDVLCEAGLCTPQRKTAILERSIVFTTDLEQVSGADLVIEAIPENSDLKRELFSRLHRLLPAETVIASNTSFLNIFELMPAERQKNAVIAHWYSPPHIIDLVEIVPGPETSPETVTRLKTLLESLGKKPVVLARFLSGYIANRLQAALNLEVYSLLDSGYATAEEIDAAIIHGLALRMPLLGHLKKADFAGLQLVQRTLANRTYTPPPVRGHSEVLDELVRLGHTGVMAGRGFYDYGGRPPEELFRERDRKLLALKKLLSEIGEIG